MSEIGVAEKKLPPAEAGFRPSALWGGQLLDTLPIGVYICGRSGEVTRYNERAAELWGRAPEPGQRSQLYCGSLRAYWPDGRPIGPQEAPMVEALATGKPVTDRECVIERPDGSRITVLLNIHPLFGADGRLEGAVNCFQDITARKRAEEAIRDNEVRLRNLLEGFPVAIYTTDAAGRITFYNRAAAELWGRMPELGEAWCGSWRLFYPDGAPMAHDRCPMALALTEGRELHGAEAAAERPDGARIAFLAYPTLLRDGSGNIAGAVNMLIDITQRKASEEQLRLLAGEVDHRAKNMLSVIQAVVHLTRAETVGAFKQAVDGRISALARAHTLLSLGHWEGADLRRIVEEELAPYAGAERVVLEGPRISVAPQIAQALAIVVHELLTNAVRHGALDVPAGRIEAVWREEGGSLRLRWSETGFAASAPSRKGFGMSIIEGAVCQQLGGTLDWQWRGDGMICEIGVPL